MLSPVRLSVVCNARALSRLKFSAIFLHHLAHSPSVDIRGKLYRDRRRGTPPCEGLNFKRKRGSDFGPIEGYIARQEAS